MALEKLYSKFSMAFCSCSSCDATMAFGNNETTVDFLPYTTSANGKIIASDNLPSSSTVNWLGNIPLLINSSR